MTGFSTCGGLTVADTLLWSQNATPKHSTISATIESQSSICGTGNKCNGQYYLHSGSSVIVISEILCNYLSQQSGICEIQKLLCIERQKIN